MSACGCSGSPRGSNRSVRRTCPRTPTLPEARLLASERDDAVHAAVARLPERDRTLIELLYSEPAPRYADIGRKLRMPVGSIGPTRSRALERLRREAPVARLAAAA